MKTNRGLQILALLAIACSMAITGCNTPPAVYFPTPAPTVEVISPHPLPVLVLENTASGTNYILPLDRTWSSGRRTMKVPDHLKQPVPDPPLPIVAAVSKSKYGTTKSIVSQESVAAFVTNPNTNKFTRYNFEWYYTNSHPVDSFNIYYGLNYGDHDMLVANVTALKYTFARTNWSERGLQHYWYVTAIFIGMESDYSRALPVPTLRNNRMMISSTNAVPHQVLMSDDSSRPIATWRPVGFTSAAIPWSTNLFDAVRGFFVLSGTTETPASIPYNPLN